MESIMQRADQKTEQTEWKASPSTVRMAQILGVEFQVHRRWTISSHSETGVRKRA